jgi:hypothetical protein
MTRAGEIEGDELLEIHTLLSGMPSPSGVTRRGIFPSGFSARYASLFNPPRSAGFADSISSSRPWGGGKT